jgi:hypothetical protein
MWPFSFSMTCNFFILVHCSTTDRIYFIENIATAVPDCIMVSWPRTQKCTVTVCHRNENFFQCKMVYTFCSSSDNVLDACNEANLMHHLSSVYSVTIPLHVSGLLAAHH